MKIYLDVSCLNRPFDDQTQPRIRLEAEAVAAIFEAFDAGRWFHVSSRMALIEIAAIKDSLRQRRVKQLLPGPSAIIPLTSTLMRRAERLGSRGFKPADAVHVAAAEAAGSDAFLTCDDRLLKVSKRLRIALTVRVENPLAWLKEQTHAPNT